MGDSRSSSDRSTGAPNPVPAGGSRLERLITLLHRFYGALPRPPEDPFALFVWEVLSAHSTPHRRDAALAALKKHHTLTPDAIWRAPQKALQESVAIAGPYVENRIGALRSGADIFRRHPDLPAIIRGPLVAARRAIRPLPQLGAAGAQCMLLFAADHAILPADQRLTRVGSRLGYGEPVAHVRKRTRSVQQALARELPASVDACRHAFLYLSHHATATCTEADPHCSVCPLLDECPEGKTRISSATPSAGGAP